MKVLKEKVMSAAFEFKATFDLQKKELDRISPKFTESAQDEMKKAILAKHRDDLARCMATIKQGKAAFADARAKAADPLMALIQRAWTSEDSRPGLQVVLEAMSSLPATKQIEIARDLDSPVATLRAFTNIKNLDKAAMEHHERRRLDVAIEELTSTYVDADAIRECAEVEKVCVEACLFENQNVQGTAADRLSLAREQVALKAVIDGVAVPEPEVVQEELPPAPRKEASFRDMKARAAAAGI